MNLDGIPLINSMLLLHDTVLFLNICSVKQINRFCQLIGIVPVLNISHIITFLLIHLPNTPF